MCNATYVCFDCRLSSRWPTWKDVTSFNPGELGRRSELVRCRKCGKACIFLGPSVEIPPKRNVSGWKRLRERVAEIRSSLATKRFKDSVRWRHEWEQEIAKLKARPVNPQRDRLIKSISKILTKGYAGFGWHWPGDSTVKLRRTKLSSKLWKKNSPSHKSFVQSHPGKKGVR